jgi:hypothetical protein
MNINNTPSPNSNLSFELYNPNGTERIVIKKDTLYLSSIFSPDYHHKIENIVCRELKYVHVTSIAKCGECESGNLSKNI